MLEEVPAKTIVNRTKDSQWFGTDYIMNIYRGCSHGCIYCDSRSDCYHIENFQKIRVKKDALRIIRNDLQRKARTGVVATGSMSDPYNPFEKDLELTRHGLELLDAYGFGVAAATKSSLITRDIDILTEIRAHSPVLCQITITTPKDSLSSQIEPYAPLASQRFAAVEALSKANLFTGLLLMPVLPFLEDDPESILTLVDRAADSGAKFIYASFGVTMRPGQREYFLSQLRNLFPALPQKYERKYGNRYFCPVPKAKELWEQFSGRCKEKGILYEMKDIISAYKMGYEGNQLTFYA